MSKPILQLHKVTKQAPQADDLATPEGGANLATLPEPQDNPHDHTGHRARLRMRFESNPKSLKSEELLEMLLCAIIPKKDVAPIARALLHRFRSLGGVLSATPEQLRSVSGIGDVTSAYLHLVHVVNTPARESLHTHEHLPDTATQAAFLRPFFVDINIELIYLLCMDVNNRCISVREVGRGTSKQAKVSVRTVMQEALLSKATGVVLAHNHLNGVAEPSPADKAATSMARQALRTIEVRLIDHIIFSDKGHTSMAHLLTSFDV